MLDEVAARGSVAFELDVVPGISAVAALTARHRIALNRVGRPVQITTGRRLAQGFPSEADDVVVMLDAGCAFTAIDDDGVDIYWGAYIGTEDEILVSGPLAEVGEEIVRVRAEARERKGWIMDTYLLRAPTREPPPRVVTVGTSSRGGRRTTITWRFRSRAASSLATVCGPPLSFVTTRSIAWASMSASSPSSV